MQREFDRYVSGYSGGNEDPLKRFFGKKLDHFIHVKAMWLWRYLNQLSLAHERDIRLLDYGCGTGEMLKWLSMFEFAGRLHGADISQAMLDEAGKRWKAGSPPEFSCIGETETDFKDHTFHLIVATCVFHHIPPRLRDAVLQELHRILIPHGKLIIFEHNPINPMTRLIVKRAVIDANAVLLSPKELRKRFLKAAILYKKTDYIMFFPPGFTTHTQQFEKLLAWCPLGAQYVVVGEKK